MSEIITPLNKKENNLLFDSKIQKKINWFGFFLAFPFLSLFGISITFFIFLVLVKESGIFWKRRLKGKTLFIAFISIGVISTFLSPVNLELESLNWVLILVQYFYWIFMAIFFIAFHQRINFLQLSKWIFYGSLFYSVAFYLIPFQLKSSLISFEFSPGRNAYIFNMLCCIPIAMYYVINTYSKGRVYMYMIIFLLLLLLSNGRSGAIIILMEMFFVLGIIRPSIQKKLKYFILGLLFVFSLTQIKSMDFFLYSLSKQVEVVNPRLASLMRSEGEGDLSSDKSWLIRELMIEKGEEIVKKHPLIGVGPNNFKYYGAELKGYDTFDKYRRLQSLSKVKLALGTSAHNTYLQAITEFGVLGLIIYLLIILKPVAFFYKKFRRNKLRPEHLVLISLIGMIIHFYTISNLSGALPWFIFGLSWALINENHKKRKLA